MNWEMFQKDLPRLVLTSAILALFAYGIFAHYSTGLEETLKNVVMLAVGFWLGSSKGTSESNERADKALDLATSAAANAGNGATSDALQSGDTVEITAASAKK